MLPAGVAIRMPSQISSGRRITPSTWMAILAVWRVSRSSETSLIAHCLDGLPAEGARRHFQGTELDQLGGGEAGRQIGLVILVHEEADGAAIHAEDGDAAPDEPVQGLEHHAVPAQGNDDIGLIGGHMGVA